MASSVALDRYDFAVFLTALVLILVGLFVYPTEPFRVLVVFVVFTLSLGWMAYALKRWVFDDW